MLGAPKKAPDMRALLCRIRRGPTGITTASPDSAIRCAVKDGNYHRVGTSSRNADDQHLDPSTLEPLRGDQAGEEVLSAVLSPNPESSLRPAWSKRPHPIRMRDSPAERSPVTCQLNGNTTYLDKLCKGHRLRVTGL
jgi:hypothetical protein